VVSSLDTFVETVENIPRVNNFVVIAIKLSIFVNQEGHKLSKQSMVLNTECNNNGL
jgi:hypothetical protein